MVKLECINLAELMAQPIAPHPPAPAPCPTWQELLAIEPRLAALEEEAKNAHLIARNDSRFCANAVWYGYGQWPGIKPRLLRLVGWEAERYELRTMAAYDVAYDHLYHTLPDCRNCDE